MGTDQAIHNFSAAARRQVLSALQLWQTFEYLSPQLCPEEKLAEMECVWRLDPQGSDDTKMPWREPSKIKALDKFFRKAKNYRFQLFAGVVPGLELIETTRELLGAPAIDFSEQKDPQDVAAFVVPLDRHGYVSGNIFVSSVPWAVRCIEVARKKGPDTIFSFSGFFGEQGVEYRIKEKVRSLLLARQLIEEEDARTGFVRTPIADPSDAEKEVSDIEEANSLQSKAKLPERRNVRPLEPEDVREIAKVVFLESGWAPKGSVDWVIKTERAPEEKGRPLEDPLNSFFAEDLEKVQREYVSGQTGPTLTKFLEMQKHSHRVDLEKDRQLLIDGVHPDLTLPACWPSKFPLVIAQQFAVNAIMRDLSDGGLFSVNGPPGTGKTTMLKDIVAAVVCQRAAAMVKFDSPLDAFNSQLEIEDDPFDPKFGVPHLLHKSLRGFGIVVACSGNVAAENISKELPGKNAIDSTIPLDYFSEVANSMGLPEKAKKRSNKYWGVISAPLGNSSNRSAFVSSFWYGPKKTENEKAAEKKFKDEASNINGSMPESADEAIVDSLRLMSIQSWVKEYGKNVPDWNTAREAFRAAWDRSDRALKRASELIRHLRQYERLKKDLENKKDHKKDREQRLHQLKLALEDSKAEHNAATVSMNLAQSVEENLRNTRSKQAELSEQQAVLSQVKIRRSQYSLSEIQECIQSTEQNHGGVHQELQVLDKTRPSLLRSIFFPRAARHWEERYSALMDESRHMRESLSALKKQLSVIRKLESEEARVSERIGVLDQELFHLQEELRMLDIDVGLTLEKALEQRNFWVNAFQETRVRIEELDNDISRLEREIKTSDKEVKSLQRSLEISHDALGNAGLLDRELKSWYFKSVCREDFHKTSPYQDSPDIFESRRQLFVAAMDLHKAFIVHSWKKLRPTLNAMMGMLQGQVKPHNVHGGPMALWDVLFLVVPLVSTTFASFPRLFRSVGCEDLAWVLIDEAGQAAPQACVGALWRAKRAVIVGDPLQLEPLINVPQELIWPLQDRCGASKQYVPPNASVQTIADTSNRFGSYIKIGDSDEPLWLGSPLIVHRRCVNPMFNISNAIAYDGKMVHGSGPTPLDDKNTCSQWIDVPADGAEEHWIPAQGRSALNKVRELVGDRPEDGDGQPLIYIITPFKSVAKKMRESLHQEFGWDWMMVGRLCGTVHTFQGKEARDVIFLLGGNPQRPGVISGFAGKNPNLVNVAVTRAKKNLYVIGDRKFWLSRHDIKGFYRRMGEMLDEHVVASTNMEKSSTTGS